MMRRLEDKVALVTGSSGGIGQGIAVRLAAEGAKVVVNYRSNPEGADETLREIKQAGGHCHMAEGYCDNDKGYSIGADLGMVEDVQRLIQQAIDHYGRLDILVNNAGIEKNADFWNVSEQDYEAVMNVNFKGVFFACQAFVKHLLEHGRTGRIVNISSVHEELPFPHFTAYCASKGAMKMLTRNLALELGPHGITINNVAPGAIETPINTKLLNDPAKLQALLQNIPLGRLGKPADVSALVAFLASDESAYVTGTTFFVDGGLLWNYQEQ
jgi:glucose 1-dehydrogenase